MNQTYTSEKTSLKQIPALHKKASFPSGSRILDYGCGAFDLGMNHLRQQGHDVQGIDPYNRSQDHNETVRQDMMEIHPDFVICSNVLNVIQEDEIIISILQDMKAFQPSTVYITVYEGNRTGNGKPTPKGYQRNMKIKDYSDLIGQVFQIESIKNGIIKCH